MSKEHTTKFTFAKFSKIFRLSLSYFKDQSPKFNSVDPDEPAHDASSLSTVFADLIVHFLALSGVEAYKYTYLI